MDYLKEFNKKLEQIDHSKNIVTKFSDFLSLSTYSLVQPFYKSPKIEEKYLNISHNYTKEEVQIFSKMLAIVISALSENFQDFLGQIFMSNDMGNNYKGQFFTPYHVSKMMAEIQLINLENLKDKNIITVSEPCSGAGGMIIAFAETLKEKGINYQNKIYVEAMDIDDLCYKMTYIQLSLLGIPAKVIKGNTLSLEIQEALYTPLFFINNIQSKLEQQKSSLEIPVSIKLEKAKKYGDSSQLSLF